MKLTNVRRQMPALNKQVHGKPMVYFDWAATTQMPQCVIDAVTNAMQCRGNVRKMCTLFLGHKSTLDVENSEVVWLHSSVVNPRK